MNARALICGILHRDPETKVSRNDRRFVQATVRCKDGDASTFWRIFAFSESVQEELLRLHYADALSVSGSMRAEIWAPEGKEPRVSFTLTADAIMPLRREKQPREKQPADAPRKSTARDDRSSTARRIAAHRSPYAPHGAHPTDTELNDDTHF
jgi:single-stranded DNA-binding protein